MKIGSWSSDSAPLLVAEIGNNHEGDAGRAAAMIDAAHESGARAVKFQTLRAEMMVSPKDAARFARLRQFELSADDYRMLSGRARGLGLIFISTPLDLDSAAMLHPLVDAYKIASGDITFRPLLEHVAKSGLPIILSTGASTLDEVEAAVSFLLSCDSTLIGRLALLHCVSSYPTPKEELNLQAIAILKRSFPDLVIGYSDHALGTTAALAAVAAGARIVEKHFTLDKNQSDFRDHQLSADPPEMRMLAAGIADLALMMGSGEKILQSCELETRKMIRRSICCRRSLPAGTVLAWSDLCWLRPEGGIAPGDEHLVIGRTLAQSVEAGAMLTEQMLRKP